MPMVPTEAPHQTSFSLNVKLAGGWDLAARLVQTTVSCLLLSSLSSRASDRSTGEEKWWSTARNQANSGQRRRDKKVSKRADARQATPTLYFTARRSWILQPMLASSSSAPVTCIHPASCRASLALLSGLPWPPQERHMETTSVQKRSVGNVVPCRVRLAARVAQTRSRFQRL